MNLIDRLREDADLARLQADIQEQNGKQYDAMWLRLLHGMITVFLQCKPQ